MFGMQWREGSFFNNSSEYIVPLDDRWWASGELLFWWRLKALFVDISLESTLPRTINDDENIYIKVGTLLQKYYMNVWALIIKLQHFNYYKWYVEELQMHRIVNCQWAKKIWRPRCIYARACERNEKRSWADRKSNERERSGSWIFLKQWSVSGAWSDEKWSLTSAHQKHDHYSQEPMSRTLHYLSCLYAYSH